ncbi:CK1/CK1/CK1-G protein kinase Cki1 [Schizosaccharomyces japonicus yFS275]|uniref:non-specific serine/threonine protein kinase n=1 Tax=Schizosaccharomyces japonicus (strain yFS275 / FY16936) TaxID=402676 RepID=B6JVJ1_SCHJY|nr:CK1/CK1/CK1-G protein kinase Cki1 [Schizosaccharomyces japonicus yFS275]EEB05392.2 CK1/CK1/CK1-G protein kinase Cki1 [Schizosaccharomyces japonicus yFS275]
MSTNIVGVHYKVGKKIGEGSFGVIFEGTNLLNNQQVAIKFEPRRSDAPQLRDEYRTYKLLVGTQGIPNVYYFGQEGLHNILVIDLLGPSLESLFDMCGRRFSVRCVALAAKQMLARVQDIHEKSLIYRDIKPDNFLIGRPGTKNANLVYTVDFGMAKFYRDPVTKQHIPYREKKNLSGTARYMSINTHLGREQSRRDDLEALGHVFMYFLRGSLPWQGLKAATNKQKYDKIGETKQKTPLDELCAGFPEEFHKYMHYTRNLGFEETPDYNYLQGLFSSVLLKLNATENDPFDWDLLNEGAGWQSMKRASRTESQGNWQHASRHTHQASRQALRSQLFANSQSNAGDAANASPVPLGAETSDTVDASKRTLLNGSQPPTPGVSSSRPMSNVAPNTHSSAPQTSSAGGRNGAVPQTNSRVNTSNTQGRPVQAAKPSSGSREKRSFWAKLCSCCAGSYED